MVAHIRTVSFFGVEARPVDVQVQVMSGLPAFTIVGLPDKAVAESKERVRGALSAIGLALPARRITVNLAPADMPKEGSHFDLPIALGMLSAMGVLPADEMQQFCVLGELGLDGSIMAVNGVLPAAIAAHAEGLDLICPAACGGEAGLGRWWRSAGTRSSDRPRQPHQRHPGIVTAQTRNCCRAGKPGRHARYQGPGKRQKSARDYGGWWPQSVAGGPPGAGKSLLAARLPGLLPPMEAQEALEVSMIASVAGTLRDGRLIQARPFRAPHHSASMPALVGGGHRPSQAKYRWRIMACCFWTSCPNFLARLSIRCVSRSKVGRLSLPGPMPM